MRCPCCKQWMPSPRMPRNAFKPWNQSLDKQLLFQADCYRRMGVDVDFAIKRMADFFERSESSILCRLQKFDLITE